MTRYQRQSLEKGTIVKLSANPVKLCEIGINYGTSDKYVVVDKVKTGKEYWFAKYPEANWYKIIRLESYYPIYEVPSFMLEVVI